MHKKLWNKDYILLLQGNAVSTIGDLMYSVAIGYWVYEQTGSNALMGVMSSLSMFVFMLLSPFSGSIADKCNRKWMIVLIDALQGALMLAMGVLAYMNALNVPLVLLTALLAAFGGVFYSPIISTLMLDIIPHDDMVRGQSIFSSTSSLINLVGKAFSGAMVAFFGVPLIVVINGLSNLYAAATELFIRVPRTVRQGEKVTIRGFFQDSKQAIRAIFSNRCMRLFVPSALILNLLGAGPSSLMLPFCMEKGLTVDMYGYLMAIQTAASLLGTVILGIVKFKPRTRYWMMGISFVASTGLLVLLYMSTGFAPMCLFAFLGSLTNCVGNAIFNAALILALPDDNRGAILGFLQSASVGGAALSALLFGLLGDVFPLYLVFAAGCILSIFPMAYMCFHRDTREFILNH